MSQIVPLSLCACLGFSTVAPLPLSSTDLRRAFSSAFSSDRSHDWSRKDKELKAGRKLRRSCRNCRDECLEVTLESACGFQRTSHGGSPRRNRSDDTHRSCCRVDDVSQLLAGDTIRVGERFHDRTDSQAVEIVVNEDEEAQTAGGKNRCFSVFDFLQAISPYFLVPLTCSEHRQVLLKEYRREGSEVDFLAHERKSNVKHLD